MKKHTVTIIHKGESARFEIRHGLGLQVLDPKCAWLEFDCRKADCGICMVRIKAGQDSLSPPPATEIDFLKAMQAAPDERLACQCRVLGPLTMEIDDYS